MWLVWWICPDPPGPARGASGSDRDVGRPISDLVSSLDFDLVSAGREVLTTLMTREMVVQADDGRWYQVRLMPYRTSKNVIDGLLVDDQYRSGTRLSVEARVTLETSY